MINKKQTRAARAWLSLSQEDLAKEVQVAKRTIADFERGATVPHDRTLRDIRVTLERLGADFLFEDGVGVGIRFRKPDVD